ncbi:hypothetical protein [Agriterribacter sp.]|uniref:hypothetical protein n=1 Tax=Agriterribacter sp. TaxID=2821509 RepID=UPI002C9A4CE4|nr:hypothetical protein [Agriterribacter sp.]HRP58467.1 hypothetical protein [Agriterribacter sp.]
MKKKLNKIIFIAALLAGSALVFSYASRTYKKVRCNIACSPADETIREEKILQSDIPFLESLTRHFLILHY